MRRGTCPGVVEHVPARPAARRPGDAAVQPRLRPDLRGARQGAVRLAGVQLRRARHGQHGDPQPLRDARGEGPLARAAPRRHDPLGVLHDRARRGLVGRDERVVADRSGRRRLRAQRQEVVQLGCHPRPLRRPDRDGQERSARHAPPAAVDDRRAARHARCAGRAAPDVVRLRGGRWTSRDRLLRRARADGEPARPRGRRIRHRPGAARTRTHPPLHAVHRRCRAGAVVDGRPSAVPHRVRHLDRAQGTGPGLDRRVAASRSTWPASTSCTPRT